MIRYMFVGGLAVALAATGCDVANDSGTTAQTSTAPTIVSVENPTDADPASMVARLSGSVAPLIGTSVSEAAPNAQPICVGAVDTVSPPTVSTPGVSAVNGWAWNKIAKSPVNELIVVQDSSSQIVGGGTTDHSRPDVPAARPEITTAQVGWHAYVPVGTGPFTVLSFDKATKTRCWIGAGTN
jgi:hypothetical protein